LPYGIFSKIHYWRVVRISLVTLSSQRLVASYTIDESSLVKLRQTHPLNGEKDDEADQPQLPPQDGDLLCGDLLVV
jgi:hypothetical protein